MNVAQTYDESGARVDCAVLYSPFLRMLQKPIKWTAPKDNDKPPERTYRSEKLLKHIVLDALDGGPCSFGELFKRCNIAVSRKGTLADTLKTLAKNGLIERYGHGKPYAYGKKPK